MLNRKDGETFKEYQIRLYTDKALLKLTNKEIGELLNKESGNKYDESKYRKEAVNWISGIEYAVKKNMDEDELIKLEDRQFKLYKQQVRTRDKLREYRKVLRDGSRLDNLVDAMEDIGKEMNENYPFKFNRASKEKNKEKVAVLLLSDLHYGMKFEHFFGSYNIKKCEENMNKVINETIEYCSMMKVKDLKIINLGDNISGKIHLGTRVSNEEDAISQIMHVSELLAKSIAEISKKFNSVEYIDTLDNHSRISEDKNQSLEVENLGRLITWYLEPRLANVKNLKIVKERLDETISAIDILGSDCYAVHGHLDQISTMTKKITMMTKTIPHTIFSAHIHHSEEKDDGCVQLVINGSMIGTDQYAKEKRLISQPMQKLLIYAKQDDKVYIDSVKHINF